MNKLGKFTIYLFMLGLVVFGAVQAVAQDEPQEKTVGAPRADIKKIGPEIIAAVEMSANAKTFVQKLTKDQKNHWNDTINKIITRGDSWCYELKCKEADEKQHIARFLYKFYRWFEEEYVLIYTDPRKTPKDKKKLIDEAYEYALVIFIREHYEKEPSTEQDIKKATTYSPNPPK